MARNRPDSEGDPVAFDKARASGLVPIAVEHVGDIGSVDEGLGAAYAYRTVDSVVLATCTVPHNNGVRGLHGGASYRVMCYKLAGPWPGTDQAYTFAVETLNRFGNTVAAVGFFTEADCKRYLMDPRGSEREYTVWDQQGRESTVVRESLGIPGKYVDWDVYDLSSIGGNKPVYDISGGVAVLVE